MWRCHTDKNPVAAPKPEVATTAPISPKGSPTPGSLNDRPGSNVLAVELSIVMPCLNEAETLGSCIRKAQTALASHGINGEIIVADNGSMDGSSEIARDSGARSVCVSEKGYGNALMGG